MDLKLLNAAPTDAERAAVDALLGPPGGNGHGPQKGRDQLLPALHAVNDRVGWISQGALNHICERLSIPPAEAYGVASFYALFALRPRPPRVVHVCDDLACKAAGSGQVRAALESSFGPAGKERDGVMWLRSPCLGVCERAPAALAFQAGAPARVQLVAPATEESTVELAARGPVDADQDRKSVV